MLGPQNQHHRSPYERLAVKILLQIIGGLGQKPLLAETDDWVAMATEYRAIATLPGAATARVWEPHPATVYAWGAESLDGQAANTDDLPTAGAAR